MFDLFQKSLIEDDIIIDTSRDNRYKDQFIPVTPNTSLDQKKQHKNYERTPPASGCQQEHQSTCQCFKSTASSHLILLLYDRMMAILSFCLTMPILIIFTLIALVDTAKRRRWWGALKQRDSNQTPLHQQNLQHLKIDEEITQNELYYAKRWGYDCQQHKVITQDGYILTLYRFAQKRKFSGKAAKRGNLNFFELRFFFCLTFFFF